MVNVMWKVRSQTELVTFVATSAALQGRPIFSQIQARLAGLLYQHVQPFSPSRFQHFLSLQWRAGMGSTQAYLFTLNISSIVPPPPQLPLQDFSHFCACCCFGSRKWTQFVGLSRGIPGRLSARAQQEFFPTPHIIRFVYTWDIFTAVN